jgi:hypothetical protein
VKNKLGRYVDKHFRYLAKDVIRML